MARLGEIYLTGLAAPDTATPAALMRIEKGAGEKEAGKESLLKRLYPQGLSIAQDLEQAASWNSRAAEAGDEAASARLGYQYASGLGKARDLNRGRALVCRRGHPGHPAGQLGLGMLHAGSYGERRDEARAAMADPCVASGQLHRAAMFCDAVALR